MRPLIAIGNVNIDLILGPSEPWPKAGTEVIVDHNELRVGGCAGNSALVWQAYGLDYTVVANIGNDQFGSWLADTFGAKAAKWSVETASTTLSVGITHPDGERTFFTTRGHLPLFTFEKAKPQLQDQNLTDGLAILSGAFLMESFSHGYDQLFDWAEQQNVSIALDTGWPMDGWTENNKSQTLSWLSRCQIALFNEIETTTLTGINDPRLAASALKQHMPDNAIVVVKCGPMGAIAVGPDNVFYSHPAPTVHVVDTIGAGDVFNAAFIAAFAAEKSIPDCLQVGIAVAAEAISTAPRKYVSHTDFFNQVTTP